MAISAQELEILAPAGRWDAMERVVAAGADAVYLGGKNFNMRQLRADFNFSDDELKSAVEYLHKRNKKIYVTVNNLYFQDELNNLREHLTFLSNINVDALIVQDLGIIAQCRELELPIPLHVSVQMGIANHGAAEILENHNISRIILSKNLSLTEISSIFERTKIEIEFFVHGDLCISHTGQCYMSSFIKGVSGNKGLCVKPCRWPYNLNNSATETGPGFFLAAKDLCLIDYLKELIEVGVISFKIEGRMRDGEYLSHLVGNYRRALDEILNGESPMAKYSDRNPEIFDKRIRNFTTANLLETPTTELFDISGDREPIKMKEITPVSSLDMGIENVFENSAYEQAIEKINISVKVSSFEQMEKLIALGVDDIVISADEFRQINNLNENDLLAFLHSFEGIKTKFWWESPRILLEKDTSNIQTRFGRLAPYIYGVIANDLGAVKMAKTMNLPIQTGIGMNIINPAAADFLLHIGAEKILASLELPFEQMLNLVKAVPGLEVMAQGPLCGMITNTCIISSLNKDVVDCDNCMGLCRSDNNFLSGKGGFKYTIRSDFMGKNYIYHPFELCLINDLPELLRVGLRNIRIDAQFYSADTTIKLVEAYYHRIEEYWSSARTDSNLIELLKPMFPQGLTSYFKEAT